MSLRPGYDDDLRLAHVIADQVDSLTMSRFKSQDLRVETKPDLTPVSDADKTAEEIIRGQLSRARPRDAVHGEEMGDTGARAAPLDHRPDRRHQELRPRRTRVGHAHRRCWTATRWSSGVVSAPALGRRWWAAQGSGAWTGKSLAAATQLHVSGVDRLEDASLSYSVADRLGGARAAGRLPRPDPTHAGAPAPTATSGRTCWSPRAPWTCPPSRSSPCTTWPRWSPSSPRPAGRSRRSGACPGRSAAPRWCPTGKLHQAALEYLDPLPEA